MVCLLATLAPNHLLYLRGVGPEVQEAVLHFLYTGQANISREMVLDFFAAAEDLGVEGLDMTKGMALRTKLSFQWVMFFQKVWKKGIEEKIGVGKLLVKSDLR